MARATPATHEGRFRGEEPGSRPSRDRSTRGYHYEFSNEFYALWLDPTMTYSCAYFATSQETLEQAQIAKVDLAFRKVGLQRGHRLLDIGCGWGAAAERAASSYDSSAVGLTLSRNQHGYALGRRRPGLALDYRLEGWETYREPCDRIVSFGAFEHFTVAKYPAFFARCRELLPDDGRLLLQTITVGKPSQSFELLRFAGSRDWEWAGQNVNVQRGAPLRAAHFLRSPEGAVRIQ